MTVLLIATALASFWLFGSEGLTWAPETTCQDEEKVTKFRCTSFEAKEVGKELIRHESCGELIVMKQGKNYSDRILIFSDPPQEFDIYKVTKLESCALFDAVDKRGLKCNLYFCVTPDFQSLSVEYANLRYVYYLADVK